MSEPDELTPYEGCELLDGESVELLPPYIGGRLPEVDKDGWPTPLLDVAWLREELWVDTDMEAEPVGSWLIDVVIPLELLARPLLPDEDIPPVLVYWLGGEPGPIADELVELVEMDIETDPLELRVGDTAADELPLP